jgi:hypothetical protein
MAVYTQIDNPELYFQVKIWSGNATDDTSITLDGDENMQPDFIWTKRRNASTNHDLWDAVRGALKQIASNNNEAQATISSSVKSFDSNGFTVGTNTNLNASGGTYVAWCWKESATAGFDILTFEGNGTDDTDISHNLSAVPHWIICRNFDAAKDWCVYHHKNTSAPETDLLVLNTTAATTDTDDRWSDEAPTSSVFTVGDSSQLNASSNTSLAYLWSEKQGYSKFGTYTGNGNNDGIFVYTGFRPAWGMFKRTDNTADWYIYDNKRNTFNVLDDRLEANEDGAETADGGDGNTVDFLSNGFKLRGSGGSMNDGTFVYMVFAEAPFVNSNGVPCNAR